ncbi:MAG: hypothetical protein ACFE8F_05315 [Promethearchaeota archaeon]
MRRQFKVIQCPECAEFMYFQVETLQNFCKYCHHKWFLHALDGQIVNNVREAQLLVQKQKRILQNRKNVVQLGMIRNPAKNVLQILRCYRADCPQWFSIHEIYQRCIESGLLPKEVQEAITALNAEGFIEKREDAIRAIPLN